MSRFDFNEVSKNAIGNLYWKNREGIYTACNHHQLNFVNLEKLDKEVGKTDFDLFPHDVAVKLRELDLEVMALGEPITREEYIPVNGELRTFLSYKVPTKDKRGNVLGIVGISIDITDLVNATDTKTNN